jgi:hypothetical protein
MIFPFLCSFKVFLFPFFLTPSLLQALLALISYLPTRTSDVNALGYAHQAQPTSSRTSRTDLSSLPTWELPLVTAGDPCIWSTPHDTSSFFSFDCFKSIYGSVYRSLKVGFLYRLQQTSLCYPCPQPHTSDLKVFHFVDVAFPHLGDRSLHLCFEFARCHAARFDCAF